MTHYFIAILIVFAGGLLSLLCCRQATLSRLIGAVFACAGCLWGMVDSAGKLFQTVDHAIAFQFLQTFSLEFRIDPLSAFFLTVIFFVCLAASLYSFHYMEHADSPLQSAVNYFFYSLLIISMTLVVTASNIITFMLSWEAMSLSSFFLVIYNHKTEENRKAAYLYFVFSHVGAMFLFSAFGIIYGFTGSFGLETMAGIPDAAKLVVFIFSFIGFGSKAGVFPFHVWLPHAHPAAPSHISAVMSGVMIKTGIYGILRIYALLDYPASTLGIIVLLAGSVSGILGVVYALGQHDLKRLLAYHSVENIGIILIGAGIGMIGVSLNNPLMAALGFSGSLLHVMNHSLFKSLLFMGAGMVLNKTGTRSIDSLGGLLKNMKITGTAFLIGSCAICGLPPFNGFVSEFLIYFSGFKGIAMETTAFVFCSIAIISLAVIGGLALACFTKVFGVVFQGEPRTTAAENVKEKGWTMLFSMAALAAVCTIIGVFPQWFVRMAALAAGTLIKGISQIPLEPFSQLTANISMGAVVFIAFLALIWIVRSILYQQKTITRSGTWGCGFTRPTVKMQYTASSYADSILDFFSPAAPKEIEHVPISGRFPEKTAYHSHTHDIAEKHMAMVIVRPVMFLFDRLRWIQHGDIHLYVGYILLAIILLLFFI